MSTVRTFTDRFHGWDAAFLENDFVRVTVVPDLGGRIMAYDLGGYPFLFTDPALHGKLFSAEEHQGDGSLAAWKNYGGDKTWPAPQGWDNDEQWHGPPDPVLDAGRYRLDDLAVRDDTAVAQVISPPDPRTGLQITRRITLHPHSSRLRLDLSFKNTTERPIRWSIWDVTQLNAGRRNPDGQWEINPQCHVTTPVNPNSTFPRGYNVMFGRDDNPQWQVRDGLFTADYQFQIGKVGLDSTAGWIAFANSESQVVLVERFAYQSDSDYPDGGASVEVWTIGSGEVGNLNYEGSGLYLMEVEILSPLYTIPPGESVSFAIEWGACRCGAVRHASEGGACSLASAAPDGAFDHIRFDGGVFDAGNLELVWLDGDEQIIAARPLGSVDPLSRIQIDRKERRPDQAARLEVRNTSLTGAVYPLVKHHLDREK